MKPLNNILAVSILAIAASSAMAADEIIVTDEKSIWS